MAIVPIGNLRLQVPESGSDAFIFELVQNMRELILYLAARCLEQSLEKEMERFLGRKRYRKAILFHSVTGLQAVTTQLADRFS